MVSQQDESLLAMLIAGEQFLVHLRNLFGEGVFLFALIDIGESSNDLKASQHNVSIEYFLGDYSKNCQECPLVHKAWQIIAIRV
jgi:hypothetical protein